MSSLSPSHMSHLRAASPQLIVVGIFCLGLVLLLGCGGKEEEKTPEQSEKTESNMDQEVFDRATSAFAKALIGTWVMGLPKNHPQYDPSKLPENPMEFRFTAANTGYMGFENQQSVFVYSVSGKVITLNYEGVEGDPQSMPFSLLSEDMISLHINGTNVIFARKGK